MGKHISILASARMRRKGLSFIACLSVGAMLMLAGLRLAAQAGSYPPLGYWRFENPNHLADASGNGNNVTVFTGQLLQGNTPPLIAGRYHSARDWAPSAGVSQAMDDNARRISISVELWLRIKQGHWEGSVSWVNKARLTFSDRAIQWEVYTASGNKWQVIDLLGVNIADPYYLLDGDWHHVAAVYSAKTGEQRVYVDGICPPGFTKFNGNGAPLLDGGLFHFTNNGSDSRLIADLDEVAVYDTIIPAQLVWEHYQQGLAHQAYNFQQQSPVATYPFPPPVQEGERNLMEFAPGYPNVPQTPLQLFSSYPLPRYLPGDSIRPLMPWMSDINPFYSGASLGQSNYEARIIHERLAHEWNYYLFAGASHGNYSYLRNSAPNADNFIQHIIDMLNAPSNAGLPRFMVTNWGQTSQAILSGDTNDRRWPYINLPSPMIAGQAPAMPDTFYMRDSSMATIALPQGPLTSIFGPRKNYAMCATPGDYRLDSIRFDGQLQAFLIDTFMQNTINHPYLDMVGENDEQVGILDYSTVFKDREIGRDYHANFPGQTYNAYQGARGTQWREAYQQPWQVQLDTMNAHANHAPLETYWYNLAGKPEAYAYEHAILRSRDPFRRGAPYFYPNNPYWWRHGRNALTGMDNVCISTYFQLLAGDSLQVPSVSPGFNDGKDYAIDDTEMERPGQFLGQLKAMACMGAETFAIFMYHADEASPVSHGNWRTWQMPMLSYAQAVTSRLQRFMYQGHVMLGDVTNTSNGPYATMYTFSTGNSNDLVTGRQLHGKPIYMIAASAQRTANDQSQAPKSKLVSLRFHDDNGATIYDPLVVEERLQGSTYMLDARNAAAPIFYQLDKWHEWKEPAHWCRDFDFEAEVWDSTIGPATRFTERPVPATSGDFSQFTTYITHPTAGAYTQYRFRPTGADQGTLYLWVHARSQNGQAEQVFARVDGTSGQTVAIPAGAPAWGWHKATSLGAPIVFSALDTTEHVLEIATGSPQVQLDRIVLMRQNPGTAGPLGPVAQIVSSPDSICLGSPASFLAKVGCSPTCFDHIWDFGDQTTSSGGTSAALGAGWPSGLDSVAHMYQYPGDYRVILTTTSALMGETASDTVWVHVGAPSVDAGLDTLVCGGGHVQLAGAQAQPQFHWESPAPAQLSDTLLLHPVATVDSSQYFYLTATDAQGCSMTDSVWVTAVRLYLVEDTIWLCPGGHDSLHVVGAYTCTWTPAIGLSNPNISTPAVTATQPGIMTYYCHATDVCGCFNLLDSVKVIVRGILENDTTICLGTPLVLHAAGPGPQMWHWTPDSSAADSIVANSYASDTYTITFDSTAGCYMDQVHVTVLPFLCCEVPGATSDWVRKHTSTLPPAALGGGTWHVYDTLFVDNSVAFTNTTFLMQPYAVVSVAPGCTLSTTGCVFKPECPEMWAGVSVKSPTARWVSRTDYVNGAIRGVWSTNGGGFQLGGSTFQACWTGAFVEGGTAANVRTIGACRFIAPSPGFAMLAPFANQRLPWAGVHLEGTVGFVVGTGPGVPGFGVNEFDRLQHGVYSRNAQVTLYNNKLVNMAASASQATYAPWNGYGLGNGAGLRAVNTTGGAGYAATVGHGTVAVALLPQYRNTFAGNVYGVQVKGRHAVNVRGNLYSNNGVGVHVNDAINGSVQVQLNNHSDDGVAIWVGNGAAVFAANTVGSIADNTIIGGAGSLHHGIRLSLLSFSGQAAYPFQVLHNTINLRGHGIWLETSSKVNVEDNRITLAPLAGDVMRGITVTTAAGNRLGANQVKTNALGLASTDVAGIYVKASGRTLMLCNITYGIGRHIVFESSCPNSDVRGNIMRSVSGSMTAAAGVSGLVLLGNGFISPQGTATSPTDNQWIGTFTSGQTHTFSSPFVNLCTLFVRSGISFTPTSNLFTGCPALPITSAIGSGINCAIQNIASSKLAAIQIAAVATTPTNALDSAIKYRTDEWAYEAMVNDTALVNNNASIQPYFNALNSSDLGAASRANLELTVPDTVGAMLESAQVTTLTKILDFQKIVQGIRIADGDIDAHELAKLQTIASECEDLGGSAVNIARSMLAAEGIFIWEDPGCEGKVVPPGRKIVGQEASANLALTAEFWPNPSSGQMFVRFNVPDLSGKLKVIDATGRVLLSDTFDYRGLPVEIDARGWAQGLILVQVELANGTSFNWRIVLER